MTNYRTNGKQVLRGSEHVADAADTTWAQIITDALNGERCPTAGITRMLAERYGSDRVDLDAVQAARECIEIPSYSARDRRPAHTWQRQQDEYACSCGTRWPVSDGEDHPATR